MNDLLATTLSGSYPQPNWLIDRQMLGSRLAPRVRAKEVWRIAPEYLEEARDDATRLALRDFEHAGLDIVIDGEMRRESYSNRFATALTGMDIDNPGSALDRAGEHVPVPAVRDAVRRERPVEVGETEFVRSETDRRVNITVPGPFTMTQQADDQYYEDERMLTLDLATAVNAEIKDLFKAGADFVQIDEPYLQARAEKARDYGVEVINSAMEGIEGETVLHTCFGYAHVVHERPPGYSVSSELDDCSVDYLAIEAAQPSLDPALLSQVPSKGIILGVLDLSDMTIESVDSIAGRIRGALEYVAADRLQIGPDCGMKYLPREVALGKLKAMVAAAGRVREELSGR